MRQVRLFSIGEDDQVLIERGYNESNFYYTLLRTWIDEDRKERKLIHSFNQEKDRDNYFDAFSNDQAVYFFNIAVKAEERERKTNGTK